jgi:hypothetical protein
MTARRAWHGLAKLEIFTSRPPVLGADAQLWTR